MFEKLVFGDSTDLSDKVLGDLMNILCNLFLFSASGFHAFRTSGPSSQLASSKSSRSLAITVYSTTKHKEKEMKRLLLSVLLTLVLSPAFAPAQDASLRFGRLTVHGTDRSETIQVYVKRMSPRSFVNILEVKITDDIGRTFTDEFNLFYVRSIEVFGMDGDDDIICNCNVDSILRGGKGNDNIYGGSGNDMLDGGEGADYLRGGPGSDELHAGPGANYLVNNILKGEEGLDEFFYNYHDYVEDMTYGDDGVYLDGSPSLPPPFTLEYPDIILGNGTMFLSEF